MKKTAIILSLVILALGLTGCSLGIKSTPKQPADGGIYLSTDLGNNWQQKAASIAQADLRFVAFNPQDDNVLYAAMANFGIFKSIDGGNSWATTTLASGNISGLAIDPINPDVLYAISGNKIIKSVDGMTKWFDTYVEPRPGQTLTGIITDPFRSNVIYATTTSAIIRSLDYGNTWKNMNWGISLISKLVQSRKNPQVLYTLVKNGIFKSIDGGVTWQDNSSSLSSFPGAKVINWLDFDPSTETMFIATSDSILKSIDGAATWTEVPTLFSTKKVSIPTVIHDPRNPNIIIFSYSNILERTDDGGATWNSLKSIPTARPITYLGMNPFHNDTIFAGTTLPPAPKKKSGF